MERGGEGERGEVESKEYIKMGEETGETEKERMDSQHSFAAGTVFCLKTGPSATPWIKLSNPTLRCQTMGRSCEERQKKYSFKNVNPSKFVKVKVSLW